MKTSDLFSSLLPAGETTAPTPGALASPDPQVRMAAWEQAWTLLWGPCLARLRRAWLRSLWGPLDLESCTAAAIQEICEETMREPGAFQSFAHLKHSTVRRAWLKSVDRWRKLGKPGGSEIAPLPMETVSREAPTHVLMDLAMVLQFIRTWPTVRREVFLLTYLEGLCSLEVALRLNLTPVNVRIILMRGRDELCREFPSLSLRQEVNPPAARIVAASTRPSLPASRTSSPRPVPAGSRKSFCFVA